METPIEIKHDFKSGIMRYVEGLGIKARRDQLLFQTVFKYTFIKLPTLDFDCIILLYY